MQRDGLINGPEEARRAVRELVKMRADVITLLVTGGVMTDGSDVGVLQHAERITGVIKAGRVVSRSLIRDPR